MRFTVRDVLWTAAVAALVAAWLVDSRHQRSLVQLQNSRLEVAEHESFAREQVIVEQRDLASQFAERARKTQLDQHHEILKLRQLLKQSLDDQRDWFELEVTSRRLLAMTPATANGTAASARTVRQAERATGLDASRLLHFMKPIEELRPQNRSHQR